MSGAIGGGAIESISATQDFREIGDFSPEVFPMDTSIFTGYMPVEHLKKHHARSPFSKVISKSTWFVIIRIFTDMTWNKFIQDIYHISN